MVQTINERFFDFQIAQQIKWIRLQNRDAQEALAILNRVDAQLDATLRKASIGDAPFTLARLEALKAQVTNLISVVHAEAGAVMTENMKEAAVASGMIEHDLFQKHLPAGLDVTTPNLGVLQQAATLRPFNGAVMSEWVDQLKTADLKRTWNHILDGITSGTTTDDLIRGLIGSKSLQYKDGVREVSRRGMEALVRTSINHATNQGRQMVWEDNSDIIKGIRWCSTLDGRTTPICQQRDGKVGPVVQTDGWTPPEGTEALDPPMARPPAHPNCRSTTCAVTKSWKELGFDVKDMPAGTRASMDGQVPADMTYFQWLGTKDEAFQKSVLGKTRYDLWKEKGIQPDRFINDKGELLSIKELKKGLPPTPVRGLDHVVFEEGGHSFVSNPIPHFGKRVTTSYDAMKASDSKTWDDFYASTIDEPRGAAKVETIKLEDLRSFQSVIYKNNGQFTPTDAPLTVLRYNGQLLLKDGNHRAVAAILRGDTTIQAKVIDIGKPPVTRLADFHSGEGGVNWFDWRKGKEIKDYFDGLDPTDFGAKQWPDKYYIDHATEQQLIDLRGAIGKVAVVGGRATDKFELLRAKFDLQEVLRSQGMLIRARPIKIADAFDLSNFEAARLSSGGVNRFAYLQYLDPTEFGLKKWPTPGDFAAMDKTIAAGILGDVRMVIINTVEGGQPARYMTNLRKKIDKALNPPAPPPIKKYDRTPTPKGVKELTQEEFFAAEKAKGNTDAFDIVTKYMEYLDSLKPGVVTAKGNGPAEPIDVRKGANFRKLVPALEGRIARVEDVMPNWVLREIEDVTAVTIHPRERAFYNHMTGELLVSVNDGADIWVHEMFHALDFKYRFEGKMVANRRGFPRDALDWHTDDPVLNRLAKSAGAEFKRRDGKGEGSLSGKDGPYWLGDWVENYEARKYAFDIEVSSEYITMNAQRYADAKMRGAYAFEQMRVRMQNKAPAMLELLDYIWTRFD